MLCFYRPSRSPDLRHTVKRRRHLCHCSNENNSQKVHGYRVPKRRVKPPTLELYHHRGITGVLLYIARELQRRDHAKRRSSGGGRIGRRSGYRCPTRQNAPADNSRPVSASAAQGLSPTVFPPPHSPSHRSLCLARVRPLSFSLSPSPSLPLFVSLFPPFSPSFHLSIPPSPKYLRARLRHAPLSSAT